MQNQLPQPNISKPTILSDFVILSKLGQGSFSSVHKVRRIQDEKLYALKLIKLPSLKPKQQQSALSEVKILAALDCPYVISFRQAFYEENSEQLCIVLQWASEGDLHADIERRKKPLCALKQGPQNMSRTNIEQMIPQSEIWRAIRDILSGLYTLHEASILHRDIKSANIFKSNGVYKLGDLNISKLCAGLAYAYTQTGTPFYASPQIWKELPYNTKSDIWSFGCVIYQMCTLVPPFVACDMGKLYQLIIRGKYVEIDNKVYSKQLMELIRMCLKTDPKQRLSAKQILSFPSVKTKFKQYHISQPVFQQQSQIINNKSSCFLDKEVCIQLSRELREIREASHEKEDIRGNGRYVQGKSKFKGIHNLLPGANYPENRYDSIRQQSKSIAICNISSDCAPISSPLNPQIPNQSVSLSQSLLIPTATPPVINDKAPYQIPVVKTKKRTLLLQNSVLIKNTNSQPNYKNILMTNINKSKRNILNKSKDKISRNQEFAQKRQQTTNENDADKRIVKNIDKTNYRKLIDCLATKYNKNRDYLSTDNAQKQISQQKAHLRYQRPLTAVDNHLISQNKHHVSRYNTNTSNRDKSMEKVRPASAEGHFEDLRDKRQNKNRIRGKLGLISGKDSDLDKEEINEKDGQRLHTQYPYVQPKQLPQIRHILASRNKNIRQQIGKLYYNCPPNPSFNTNYPSNYLNSQPNSLSYLQSIKSQLNSQKMYPSSKLFKETSYNTKNGKVRY